MHGASSLNGLDIGYRIETEANDVAKLTAPNSMDRRVLGLPSLSMIVPGSPYVRRIATRVRRRKLKSHMKRLSRVKHIAR